MAAMGRTSRQSRPWRYGCGGFVAACLVLALLIALGSFAIARGRVVGPAINVQVGAYHLVSRTTTTPDCQPLAAGCVAATQAAGSAPRYYTIWVMQVSEVPFAGGVQEHLESARILTLPVIP
jgi:hypothetical protein